MKKRVLLSFLSSLSFLPRLSSYLFFFSLPHRSLAKKANLRSEEGYKGRLRRGMGGFPGHALSLAGPSKSPTNQTMMKAEIDSLGSLVKDCPPWLRIGPRLRKLEHDDEAAGDEGPDQEKALK